MQKSQVARASIFSLSLFDALLDNVDSGRLPGAVSQQSRRVASISAAIVQPRPFQNSKRPYLPQAVSQVSGAAVESPGERNEQALLRLTWQDVFDYVAPRSAFSYDGAVIADRPAAFRFCKSVSYACSMRLTTARALNFSTQPLQA